MGTSAAALGTSGAGPAGGVAAALGGSAALGGTGRRRRTGVGAHRGVTRTGAAGGGWAAGAPGWEVHGARGVDGCLARLDGRRRIMDGVGR